MKEKRNNKKEKRMNRGQDESSGNSDDNTYADIIFKQCTGNTCHLQLHVGNCN